jgi:flagellar assembly factor FliW
MKTCSTRYHGEIEYSEDEVVSFPRGLFGFETEKQFLMIELPAVRPLVFLQSLSTPGLCFLALPVGVVEKDYQLDLADEDLEELELPAGSRPRIGEDVLCLVLLTVQANRPTTANLMAPVTLNLRTRKALQAISTNDLYSHQHVFLEPAKETVCS